MYRINKIENFLVEIVDCTISCYQLAFVHIHLITFCVIETSSLFDQKKLVLGHHKHLSGLSFGQTTQTN